MNTKKFMLSMVCVISHTILQAMEEHNLTVALTAPTSIFEQQINKASQQLKKIDLTLKDTDDATKKLENFTNITLEKFFNLLDIYDRFYVNDSSAINSRFLKKLCRTYNDLLKIDQKYIACIQQYISKGLQLMVVNAQLAKPFYTHKEISSLSESLLTKTEHTKICKLLSGEFHERYNDNKGLLAEGLDQEVIKGAVLSQVKNDLVTIAENDKKIQKLLSSVADLNNNNEKIRKSIDELREKSNEIDYQNSHYALIIKFNKEQLQQEVNDLKEGLILLNTQLKNINEKIKEAETRVNNLDLLKNSNHLTESPLKNKQVKIVIDLKKQAEQITSDIKAVEASIKDKESMVEKSTQSGTIVGNLKRSWFGGK